MHLPAIASSRRLHGFTALELLAVLCLFLVLAALLGAALPQAFAESRKTRCISHQRTLYLATLAYSADHQGRYPLRTTEPVDPGRNWHRTIWPYLDPSGTYSNWGGALSLKLYRCPANPSKASAISYAMNDNLIDKLVSHHSGGRVILLIDHSGSHLASGYKAGLDQRLAGWHRKKNILTFGDGHVSLLARPAIPDRATDPAFWGVAPQ